MAKLIEKVGEEALKAGGGLAIACALLGGFLAWPRDCQGAAAVGNVLGSPSNCHNVFGSLPTDTAAQMGTVIGFASVGAIAGALLALALVELGVFKRSELGMDDDH